MPLFSPYVSARHVLQWLTCNLQTFPNSFTHVAPLSFSVGLQQVCRALALGRHSAWFKMATWPGRHFDHSQKAERVGSKWPLGRVYTVIIAKRPRRVCQRATWPDRHLTSHSQQSGYGPGVPYQSRPVIGGVCHVC